MTTSQVRTHQKDLSVENYFPHRPFHIFVCRRVAYLVQLVLAQAAFLKIYFALL